jgi:mannosyltransferase OCH1-like enzyme
MKWFVLLSMIIILYTIGILTSNIITKKERYQISNQKIPKNIFQTISNKKDINDGIQKNIEYLRAENPEYKYVLFDENDCIDFIKKNYNKDILDTYLLINPNYGPARADLFRYLLMYKYGGIYLDIKSSCNTPLSDIIKDDTKYILAHWSHKGHRSSNLLNNFYGEFQQWHIICIPQHPFLKRVIETVIDNIKKYNINKDGVGKDMVLNITGPIAYTKAILPIINQYDHILYKSHKDVNLVYKTFDHVKYFGNKHYTKCTEPLTIKL